MKLIFFLALTLSAGAFARPAKVDLDDASIDVAIALFDKYPGTFSIDGECAKNEAVITNYSAAYSTPEIKLASSTGEYVISKEEEREAVVGMFARLGVPMIDTGCPVKIGRVTIVAGGCGLDEAQKFSATFETLE